MHLDQSDEDLQQTIENLINEISFSSKKQKDSTTKSVSGSSMNDSFFDTKQKKQRSKAWTQEENRLFIELLEQYGTDFTLIKEFFPKKSKNQIKKKYKSELKTLNFKFLPFNNVSEEGEESMKQGVAKAINLSNILGKDFLMITEELEVDKEKEKEKQVQGEREKEVEMKVEMDKGQMKQVSK